jgi:hypothetical protein
MLDLTNMTTIVNETHWNTGTLTNPIPITVTSFSNVPANEAVFELDYRRVVGTGDVNLHSMILS